MTTVSEIVIELKKKLKIYFGGNKVLANVLAGDIIYKEFDSTLSTGINRGYIIIDDKESEIYYYENGIYKIDGEQRIRDIAQRVLGDKANRNNIAEVLSAVKNLGVRVKRNKLNKYPNLINLKTNIYNIETKETIPHSMDYYFTTQLDIIYNKEAVCPKCLKFFSEVHKPEDIPIIQELFGYCLYQNYDYHYMYFFLGSGRNGKGTELRLLIAFLGEENIVGDSPQALSEETFAPAHLFGKLADICGDIGSEPIKNSEILKKMTGGDLISAQRKFQHSFNFFNFAKPIWSSNTPPEIIDRSDGMWDRMIHITFPNKFAKGGVGTDPKLDSKLQTPEELSGLLNWAIVGLERLIKNEKMSYSLTTDENMRQYDRKASPVLAFAQDCLETSDDELFEFKTTVRTQHQKYCVKYSLTCCNEETFTKQLKNAIPSCDSTRRVGSAGNQRPVYYGIQLKTEHKNGENEEPKTPKERADSLTKNKTLDESFIPKDDKTKHIEDTLKKEAPKIDDTGNTIKRQYKTAEEIAENIRKQKNGVADNA